MDQTQIQNALQRIYSQYPWASEESAEQLANATRSSSIKSAALAVAITNLQGLTGAEELKKTIQDTSKTITANQRKAQRRIAAIEKNIRSLGSINMSSASGLEAMTELSYAGAQAMDAGAQALSNMAGGTKLAPLAGIANFATGTSVAVLGVATVFGKLIATQEKELRGMIDMGMTLGDTSLYTQLRSNAAETGLRLAEYASIMQNSSAAITGITGDMISGSGAMYRFLTDGERIKRVKNFGYTPKELTGLLAEETDQLYMLNQVNELNAFEQSRVIDSFETANKMGIYLADTLGVQRSAMLESRKIMRENIDFQLAMAQNTEYLNETYGEGTANRVRESADFLSMLASATLGEEMANKFAQVFTGTISDIQFDDSAVNNIIDDEFRNQLQLMGPGVYEEFVTYIEDSVTGQVLSPEQHAVRFQKLITMIKESPTLLAIDPTSVAVNKLIADAILLPEGFFDGTEEELRIRMEGTQNAIDGADDSIEALGGMQRTFVEALDTITPGFETMGMVMGILEGSVGRFADFWRRLFGLDPATDAAIQQELMNFREQSQTSLLGGRGYSVGGTGPIDTTTIVAYDRDSASQAIRESRTAAYNEATALNANIKAVEEKLEELTDNLESIGLDDLTRNVDELRTSLDRAKLDGDESVAQIEEQLGKAIRELETATAESSDISIEITDARAQLESMRTYKDELGQVFASTTGNISKRTSTDVYAPGSTLQGIVISELIAQGIDDPRAQANILGMIQGESGFRVGMAEQSYANTSNSRIRWAMGNRVAGLSDQALTQLKKDPVRFYDYVYRDLGGYKYRGRGFIQLTGIENYKLVGDMIGEDLVNNPDLMLNTEVAARASAAYFNLPWWQQYKDQLHNMNTVFRVVYGQEANQQNGRLGDLATRTNYASQFFSSMQSGELTASEQLPARIRNMQNTIEGFKADMDEGVFTYSEEEQVAQLARLEEQLRIEMEKLQQQMAEQD